MKNQDLGYQKAFGAHIAKVREERGWVQSQLAAVAEMEKSQISAIENGRNSLTLKTIVKLAIALGKQPEALFNFKYPLKLNTDFGSHAKKRKLGTTDAVTNLSETDFFASPRSVAEVVDECQNLYKISLESVQTSIALKKLVIQKKLKRIPSKEYRTKYRYQKRQRKS